MDLLRSNRCPELSFQRKLTDGRTRMDSGGMVDSRWRLLPSDDQACVVTGRAPRRLRFYSIHRSDPRAECIALDLDSGRN